MNRFLVFASFLFFVFISHIRANTNFNSHQFYHLTTFNGLSNSTINCIYQDHEGFIWIGTNDGLNRYDGYEFKVYRSNYNRSGSIGHNTIKYIGEDSKGNLWIGTDASIDRFDRSTNSFIQHYINKSASGKYEVSSENEDNLLFLSYYIDKRDFLWVNFGDGVFYYDLNNTKLVDLNPELNMNSRRVNCYFEDPVGNIWLGTLNQGVYKINSELNKAKHYYHVESSEKKQKILDVRSINQISNGEVLIGTLGNGIFSCSATTSEVKKIPKVFDDVSNASVLDIVNIDDNTTLLGTNKGITYLSLPEKKITNINFATIDGVNVDLKTVKTIFKDLHGNIWLGTFKNSLFFISTFIMPFNRFSTDLLESNLSEDFHVSALTSDKSGNLWTGLDGKGLLKFNTAFYPVEHYTKKNEKLSSDKVLTVHIDNSSGIWAGTYYGGVSYLDNKEALPLVFNSEYSAYGMLANSDIRDILEDSEGNIWLATHGGGVVKYHRELKKLIALNELNRQTMDSVFLSESYVFSLCEDQNGNIWVGTLKGIFKYDKSTSSVVIIKSNLPNTSGLTDDVILDIIEDSGGTMWFGTSKGLHKLSSYDNEKKIFQFEHLGIGEGLINPVINSLIEDDFGAIWVGTNKGISRYNPNKQKFKNFGKLDGVFTEEFSVGAVTKRGDGTVFFGGPKGIVYFQPAEIRADTVKPIVKITGLKLFNRPVEPGEIVNNRVLLTTNLSDLEEIRFLHRENVFTLDFVGIQFNNPAKNKYRYILEGFNEEWINASADQRSATYTNLRPGKYTFRVTASNSSGIWNNSGDSIDIVILPPFWQSKLAIVAYLIIITGVFIVSRRIVINRVKLKNELRIQKIETEKEHEISEMKMRFFTNISHEFKTPLTLILELVNKMLKDADLVSPNKDHLKIIERNATRLQQLINQLLDMRRLQAGKLNFTPGRNDIVGFCKEITDSFQAFADDLEIQISFKSTVDELVMWFDLEKLEIVIINLISNALKYTPNGGKINLNISTNSDRQVCIRLSDTGVGVSKEEIDKIFDRFYQADNVPYADAKGTGIGLSFVKDLVELHNGTIKAASYENQGTTFTILLPIEQKNKAETNKILNVENINGDTEFRKEIKERAVNKPKLIIVEDYLELRQYLNEELSDEYSIYEARNGKIGLDIALKVRPDVILSDIMMPEMDGFELCKAVKTHEELSHTPVILLTSKTEEQAKLKGFEFGADAYIEKPFKIDILKLRIANIVSTRKSLINRIKSASTHEVQESPEGAESNKLLKKAIDIVEKSMGNSSFGTDSLARELGMSRTKLYNKLGEASGHPVREFIQLIRLKKAAELLRISDTSITEISFSVGFKDPAHFSKSFHKLYNKSPKDFRSNK